MNARDPQPQPSPRPALLRADRPRRRILVPVDGSPPAQAAVADAVALASRLHAVLRFVHVADPRALLFDPSQMHATASTLVKAQRAEGQAILRRAVAQAHASGVDCDSTLLCDPPSRVTDLLIHAIGTWRADLVVMGTHARQGLDRLLMGSTAQAILQGSPVPVLMVPGPRGRPA